MVVVPAFGGVVFDVSYGEETGGLVLSVVLGGSGLFVSLAGGAWGGA